MDMLNDDLHGNAQLIRRKKAGFPRHNQLILGLDLSSLSAKGGERGNIIPSLACQQRHLACQPFSFRAACRPLMA